MFRPSSILIYYDGSAEAKCALNRTGEPGWSSSGDIYVLVVADTATAIVSSAGMLSGSARKDFRYTGIGDIYQRACGSRPLGDVFCAGGSRRWNN